MYLWILVFGSFAAFYNAWGIGANDCANSFATSVGAKVLTLNKAIIIASIFEFLGAFLMGSHVTSAIRKKIVSYEIFKNDPGALMFGMMCCNVSAGIWLNIATYFKFPVSTTHSIIGAIIGFSLAYGGSNSILWDKVGMVIASWVLSPVLAGILSLFFYTIIKKYVFTSNNPVNNTIKIFPILTFFTFLINGFFIFYKGTPQLKLDKLDLWVSIVTALSLAVVTSYLSWHFYIPYAKKKMLENRAKRENNNALENNNTNINTEENNNTNINTEENNNTNNNALEYNIDNPIQTIKEHYNSDNILILNNNDNLNTDTSTDDTNNDNSNNSNNSNNLNNLNKSDELSRTSSYKNLSLRETNLDTLETTIREVVVKVDDNNITNSNNNTINSDNTSNTDDTDDTDDSLEHSNQLICFKNNKKKLQKQKSYKINNITDDIYLPSLNIAENVNRLKSYISKLSIKEKAEKIELLHKNAITIDPDAEFLCSSLQVITACFSSFAHGANDVANSIAPFATVYSIYETESVSKKMDVPIWILFIGGFGIVIGLATWGYKIIDRIGQELTKVTPSRGFIIELSAALTTLIASRAELPVSTTHCQIGSVIGCGLGDNKNNVEWKLFKEIIYSWIITLPATGFLAAGLFSFGYYAP